MSKTLQTKSSNNRTVILLIIIVLSVFLLSGCQQSNTPANGNSTTNGNSAVNKTTTVSSNANSSTPSNANTTAPSGDSSKLEKKANAIVGKWETTTALDDKITFDFSQPKKEGETYVGTYKFIVNDDTSEPPAKYIVSGDKMIKFFNAEGKEYPLIKVSISDDGQTLMYDDQKGGKTKLTKAGSATTKSTESASGEKGDCTLKEENAEFFISATEKTVKLKKATPIKYVMFGNQGIAVVEAKIDGKWVRGEIEAILLDCPDDGKDEPVKK
jgi:hypothetical protein